VTSTFESRPLRVAVVGSGPSGLFAVDALLKNSPVPVNVDVIERLPTPYGLVRYGVAPDHAKIKSVITTFAKTLGDPRVRFLGNVAFGRDLTLDDVLHYYDAALFAVGAPNDRALGIPGEDLPGSMSATEFVAWYSGHPDALTREIALHADAVAVIGAGNVAIDVARILAKHVDELRPTDIPHHVLDALEASHIRDIYLIGRRGPAQAKFTTAELRELGELANADVILDPAELELDPASAEAVAAKQALQRNLDVLRDFAAKPPAGRPRRLHLRFLASPVEIVGTSAVEALVVECNKLDELENAVGTGAFETIPVQMIFRAVGYRGEPLPGLPFDAKRYVIPNDAGRVLSGAQTPLAGAYVAGWIKRGPTGVIGTNKADAAETVRSLLADLEVLPGATEPEPEAVDRFLAARGTHVVGWEHWLEIDAHEIELGREHGRERTKLAGYDEIVKRLREAREREARPVS
jgi:ferredoxin--NADP+ reductase